jgi:hypothetical protein
MGYLDGLMIRSKTQCTRKLESSGKTKEAAETMVQAA